jgi:hypothetical protein
LESDQEKVLLDEVLVDTGFENELALPLFVAEALLGVGFLAKYGRELGFNFDDKLLTLDWK